MASNRYYIYFVLFGLLILWIGCKEDTILPQVTEEQTFTDKLKSIAGIAVEELEAVEGYKKVYRILVTQPIDHNNPTGPTFTQEVFLKHQDQSLPVIYNTRGYSANAKSSNELTELFPANYIAVEHRYFAESTPQALDWKYLTIEQAANDHHRIVDLLDELYAGKWVSTGTSKGGMTALFHKRFYPDDVHATVAYVAPIITGLPDPRFDQFLSAGVGDASCRKKIEDFQKTVLSRKTAMLSLYQQHQVVNDYSYSIGIGKVLELTALEYQFSFWQYGWSACDEIPDSNATDQEVFNHLVKVSPAWYYNDEVVEFFHPFFYQAYTELGYYFFVDDHLSGLINELAEPSHRDLTPDVVMNYDPMIMQDILDWLHSEGDYIVYIYGEKDPYTATAVPEPIGTNALRIIQPGANHSVKIKILDEKQLVYKALEEWLDVEIE